MEINYTHSSAPLAMNLLLSKSQIPPIYKPGTWRGGFASSIQEIEREKNVVECNPKNVNGGELQSNKFSTVHRCYSPLNDFSLHFLHPK